MTGAYEVVPATTEVAEQFLLSSREAPQHPLDAGRRTQE